MATPPGQELATGSSVGGVQALVWGRGEGAHPLECKSDSEVGIGQGEQARTQSQWALEEV